MDDTALRGAYLRLTWRKVTASKTSWGACAALAAIAAVFWVRESAETAVRMVLILGPYLFLALTQDMMRGEIDAGTLENVLFIDGGFKRYLRLKSPVVVAASATFMMALFAAPAVPAALSGSLSVRAILPLVPMSLAVGVYYVLLGNTLSLFLKGGSNVMAVLVAQAAVVVALILTVKADGGVLAYLETGAFPGIGERLAFMGLAAVCPAFVMSPRFLPYALEFLALAALLWGVQSAAIRRLELERR
jgi:hypothetical protein